MKGKSAPFGENCTLRATLFWAGLVFGDKMTSIDSLENGLGGQTQGLSLQSRLLDHIRILDLTSKNCHCRSFTRLDILTASKTVSGAKYEVVMSLQWRPLDHIRVRDVNQKIAIF